MNEQFQQQILSRLDALASKLGVAAGHLWDVLVRQQYIDGAMNAAASLFFLVVFILAVCLALSYRHHRDGVDSEWRAICGGVATLVSLIALSVTIPAAATCLLNPEFGAFQYLVAALK